MLALNCKNNKKNKLSIIFIIALALNPLLAWYDFSLPMGLGPMIMLVLSTCIIVLNRFKITVLPKSFILVFLYISIMWIINNGLYLWTIIPPGGWPFFSFVLCLIAGTYVFELKKLRKAMKVVVWISIPLFWIQFILLKIYGSQQICFVPPFSDNLIYEGLTYTELVNRQMMSNNPCSIFIEKSYMAYYLISYICLLLFKNDNRNKFYAVELCVIAITILFLNSGSGLVGFAILFLIKVFSLLWKKNLIMRIGLIILLAPFIAGVYFLYQNSEMGNRLLSRQSEFTTENTSGYDRTIGGYIMYYSLSPDEKMEKPEQTGTVRRSRLGHF